MGDVKVKVVIANIARGASPTESTVYKKDETFICTAEEAKKLGKDVEIIEAVEDTATETRTPINQKTSSGATKK